MLFFSPAETEPHEGKRKVESLWPIFRIHHQKTRYIFDLFYKRKAISRELYEYCIKEGYADKNNLCCLRCIQTRDTNFGTNCICRVPKSKLEVVMPGGWTGNYFV
ncbi:Protein BUD31 homolog [Lemmus lemmus]